MPELPFQTYSRITGKQWPGGRSPEVVSRLKEFGITDTPGSAKANLALQKSLLAPVKSAVAPAVQPTIEPEKTSGVVSGGTIAKDLKKLGIPSDDPEVKKLKSDEDFETFKKEREARVGAEKRPERETGRVKEREKLLEDEGIFDLQEKAIDLESQVETELAALREFRASELQDGVTTGFAMGRIREEERGVQEKVDFLNRQLKTVNARLRVKNQNVRDIMKLSEMDWQEANELYDQEYTKNLNTVLAFEKEEEKELANEKATYTTMYNMWKDKSFDEIPENVRGRMSVIESVIGLPEGSFEAVMQAEPASELKAQGTSYDEAGNQTAWFITTDTDGNPKVQTVGTGGFKKPAETAEEKAKKKAEAKQTAFDFMDELISLNPEATDDELKEEIQKNSQTQDLDQSEINTKLKNRISDNDITFEAEGLVADVFDKKLFKTRSGELEKAKKDAKDKINKGGIILIDLKSGGEKQITLTPELQKRFIKAIDGVDVDTVLEINVE